MAELLGPFPVGFGDLQLPRKGGDDAALQPPMMRVYYPCRAAAPGQHSGKCRWLPAVAYAYGYLCNMARPTSALRRTMLWIFAGVFYAILWPGSVISAIPRQPILVEDDDKEKFPVVIFSHGLWACRATYSAFCSDLASYGYIVVAPEHLDGSANMACYIDNSGETKWIEHKYASGSFKDLEIAKRDVQLKQRVKEVELVLDALHGLENDSVSSNLVTGDLSLDTSMFKGKLDLSRLAIAGHSFGGATAVISPGAIHARFKCSLGLDVWWEPVEKVDYQKVSGGLPVLLLNTENFDWKTLKEARLVYLNARAAAKTKDGQPLETRLVIIKRTEHQDQSDFPIFLTMMSKSLKLSGEIDVRLAKDINSRTCLEFLQKHMRVSGKKYPSEFRPLESDNEFLVGTNI